MAQLTKSAKKAVLLGMLAMIQNGSKFVYCGERSRKVFHYCLDWSSRICKAAFCAVTNCKAKTMKLLQKSFSDRDVAPQMHGNSKSIPYNAISVKDKSNAVNFIQKYAAIHGLSDPGHTRLCTQKQCYNERSVQGILPGNVNSCIPTI